MAEGPAGFLELLGGHVGMGDAGGTGGDGDDVHGWRVTCFVAEGFDEIDGNRRHQRAGDDGDDVGQPVIDDRQHNRAAMRRVVRDVAEHGDDAGGHRAQHDAWDHSQRVGRGKGNRAFGDADQAHGEAGDARLDLFFGPQLAVEQRGDAQPQRRRANGGGAGAHDVRSCLP